MIFWDWLWLAGYAVIILGTGLYYWKRASADTAQFFVSGRRLGWVLAGTSMVATTFAADTPLAVTGLTLQHGIAGNWLWWSMALTGMLTVIFFSKMWQRSGMLTDVALAELRYSGRPAAFLRGFRALYLGVPINIIIMGGFVTVAMIKIVQYLLFQGMPLEPMQKLLIVGGAFAAAGIYSTVSGLWGVVVTDFIQFGLAMLGSIVLAAVSVDAAGGLSRLTAQIKTGAPQMLNFLPRPGTALFLTVTVYLSVQWWASWYPGSEPGGGGYNSQRMFACRDEKQSWLATMWFTVAHYAVRSWPWILTALAASVLLPEAAGSDKEALYPLMVARYMPAGLKGLMLTGFFAAYMSTVTTHLNWGASYVVNDFYRRFIRTEKPEKHYVSAARITTLLLMGLSIIPALLFDSVKDAWVYILNIGAGTGLVLILRWFWHRINAWSEISAMGASLIISTLLLILRNNGLVRFASDPLLDDALSLAVTVGLTTLTWVTVTLLTKPESEEKLRDFFEKVQPAGITLRGRRTAQGAPVLYRSPEKFAPLFLKWLAGSLMIYLFLFGTGELLLGSTLPALLMLATGCLIFVRLKQTAQS